MLAIHSIATLPVWLSHQAEDNNAAQGAPDFHCYIATGYVAERRVATSLASRVRQPSPFTGRRMSAYPEVADTSPIEKHEPAVRAHHFEFKVFPVNWSSDTFKKLAAVPHLGKWGAPTY